MPAREYRVRGRVQGVGFRWWTRSRAHEMGIGGTVRNHPDGSVVIVAVGDGAALRSFRSLLESGPPSAVVERVEEKEIPDRQTEPFTIIS